MCECAGCSAVNAARVDGVFSNSDFALVGFPCVAAGLAVARVFFLDMLLLLFMMAVGMDGTCVLLLLLLLCTVWYLLLLFGKRNSVAFVYVCVYKTRHILVSRK